MADLFDDPPPAQLDEAVDNTDLFEGWTRDQAGNFIDWTHKRFHKRGVLNLKLPHETDISAAEITKRTQEYMKLTMRALRRRTKNARGVGTHSGVVGDQEKRQHR